MFDENSIVDRVLRGDGSAFERLAARYEHKVYQYALRFLGQEEDACAATEEIFGRIYRQLGTCPDTHLSTWVFRITAEVCAEYQHRKRNAKNSMFGDVFHLREPMKEERELSTEIRGQLLRLVRQQREVLLLRDLCGLDDEETGRVLSLDEAGVRQRLSRARKNLRDLLIKQNVLKDADGSMLFWHNMPRDCQNFRELCSQYVDGCISEEEKSRLLDHIQECTACAAYLNDLTAIGRSLSHMEEQKPPEELHSRIMEVTRREEASVRMTRKKLIHRPILVILALSALSFLFIVSGTLGGLFINAQNVPQPGTSDQQEHTESLLTDDIRIPEIVSANSYSFAIAASGNTELPELSTSATLLFSDVDGGVAYYTVPSDLSLVQKLIGGLETVGYETEMVNNHQLVITTAAPQGLIIIIHYEKEQPQMPPQAALASQIGR